MKSHKSALPILKKALVPFGLHLGTFHTHPAKPLIASKIPTAKTPQPAPTISMVTPSFNQGQFLEETILSILDQDYPSLQYIVQDGGSTDDSTKIIARHEHRLTQWTSAPDQGQADAINLGFAQTDGQIMAWLNADDILLPGSLATVADYFHRHPNVDVVYSHRIIIDKNSEQVGRWILPNHKPSALLWRDYIPQETMFWRRSLWDQVGRQVRSDFQFAMDWELVGRFHLAGARFVRLPHFLACFRTHDAQKSLTQRVEVGQQEFALIRKTLLSGKRKRLAAQISGLGYLAESMLWNWTHRFQKPSQ